MTEVRVITAETADTSHFMPPAEWGEDADGVAVTGGVTGNAIRYVELSKDGMPQLGITVLADGSLELETFGHGYSLKLAGVVVLQKG